MFCSNLLFLLRSKYEEENYPKKPHRGCFINRSHLYEMYNNGFRSALARFFKQRALSNKEGSESGEFNLDILKIVVFF